MIRIFLAPPAIVAVYLVAINWVAMYTRPDTIAIPILFEMPAFALHFVRSLAVHLCLVVPAAFITLKLTGSRLAGIALALLDTQAFVVESLIDKPGGLIRYRSFPPAAALDNMHNWELGVQRQIDRFIPLLESFTFFTSDNPYDPHTTHLKTPLRLQQANYNIGLVTNSPDSEGESRSGMQALSIELLSTADCTEEARFRLYELAEVLE